MEEILIELSGISKRYGHRIILKDIDLKIYKGETIAFVGYNGSGKSTLLKMICGLVRVSSGKILSENNLKYHYIPERFAKLSFTIPQFLGHMGRLEEMKKEDILNKTERMYEMFYLNDMLDTPMKYLSKGTLQKAAVMQALLTKADVLLMDEPISGQDAKSQENFMKAIKELIRENVTVLMSCHEMAMLDALGGRRIRLENQKCFDESFVTEKGDK